MQSFAFDGDFRRKPPVKSDVIKVRHSAGQLLGKAREERLRRQSDRQKVLSCIKIQSSYRAFRVRKKYCEIFNSLLKQLCDKVIIDEVGDDEYVSSSGIADVGRILTLSNFILRMSSNVTQLTEIAHFCDEVRSSSKVQTKLMAILFNTHENCFSQKSSSRVSTFITRSCEVIRILSTRSRHHCTLCFPYAISILGVNCLLLKYVASLQNKDSRSKLLRVLLQRGLMTNLGSLFQSTFNVTDAKSQPTVSDKIVDTLCSFSLVISTLNFFDQSYELMEVERIFLQQFMSIFVSRATHLRLCTFYESFLRSCDISWFINTLSKLLVEESLSPPAPSGNDGHSAGVNSHFNLCYFLLTVSSKVDDCKSNDSENIRSRFIHASLPILALSSSCLVYVSEDIQYEYMSVADDQHHLFTENIICNECVEMINANCFTKSFIEIINNSNHENLQNIVVCIYNFMLVLSDVRTSIVSVRSLINIFSHHSFTREIFTNMKLFTHLSTYLFDNHSIPSNLLSYLKQSKSCLQSSGGRNKATPIFSYINLFVVTFLYNFGEISDDQMFLNSTPFGHDKLSILIRQFKDVWTHISISDDSYVFPNIEVFCPSFKLYSKYNGNYLTHHGTIWFFMFKESLSLIIRHIYKRFVRYDKSFTSDENYDFNSLFTESKFEKNEKFMVDDLNHVFTDEYEDDPTITQPTNHLNPSKEVRKIVMVLQKMPFLFSFQSRVAMFHSSINKLKKHYSRDALLNFFSSHQNEDENNPLHVQQVVIRRKNIYQDAFMKFNENNANPLDLNKKIQIIFKNEMGAEESGIDGGGIFKEFLNELFITAFDPNRGLFKLSPENMLYPNPNVGQFYSERESHSHYFFIGRVLAKTIYEKYICDLPLSLHFLSKLLKRHEEDTDVVDELFSTDLNDLIHVDKELFNQLSTLKDMSDEQLSDLNLDFSISNENVMCEGGGRGLGISDLLPDGRNQIVDGSNRRQYVKLMADFKLNVEIDSQCESMRKGVESIFPVDWLSIFNNRELSIILCGSDEEISVNDLKLNTTYGNGFHESHPTILLFWDIMFNDLKEDELKMFLKFVTSCPRPPFNGFQELDPRFCIHSSGSDEERLPSASTCINFLKLPQYQTKERMLSKLLYAINSNTGFELS